MSVEQLFLNAYGSLHAAYLDLLKFMPAGEVMTQDIFIDELTRIMADELALMLKEMVE